MVKKIALEEHFLCPGFIEYWNPTVAEMPAAKRERLLSAQHRLRRAAARLDGQGRHRARRAGARRPRRAGRARHRDRDPQRQVRQRLPGQGNPEAAGPLFRLRASADAGRQGRRRRARALRQGAEILRRHDQRPHQRAISRPPVAVAVLGARRGARHADLHPSDRSGVGRAGAAGPSGPAPRHLGMDLRDRLARAAAGVRRRVRPLPEGARSASATWARRCRSCCGASTAAPGRTSTTSA